MKKTRFVYCLIVLFGVLIFQPGIVQGDTTFFDDKGHAVGKSEYAQLSSDRDVALKMSLKKGYQDRPNAWIDPIKLRQKRIEQWRKMRQQYHPDSLPAKIGNPSTRDDSWKASD